MKKLILKSGKEDKLEREEDEQEQMHTSSTQAESCTQFEDKCESFDS